MLTPDGSEVVVVLTTPDYLVAKAVRPPTQVWQLRLNGLALSDGVDPVRPQEFATATELRFRVHPATTADGQRFWSEVFQENRFNLSQPIAIEVGWPSNPEYLRPPENLPPPEAENPYATPIDRIKVAPASRYATAGGCILAALLMLVVAMKFSDVFRVGSAPSPALVGPPLPVVPQQGLRRWMSAAWHRLRMPRQAYSLAKVQWGMWMTFAVTGAFFLWAVFGTTPVLTGSLVGLTAISTLSATTSLFVDAAQTPPPPPAPSVNLWTDLLSGGTSDALQAHRFQAVMVNFMLLVMGVAWIVNQLSFPVFDAGWLALLGISNAAQLAVKAGVETKTVPPAQG